MTYTALDGLHTMGFFDSGTKLNSTHSCKQLLLPMAYRWYYACSCQPPGGAWRYSRIWSYLKSSASPDKNGCLEGWTLKHWTPSLPHILIPFPIPSLPSQGLPPVSKYFLVANCNSACKGTWEGKDYENSLCGVCLAPPLSHGLSLFGYCLLPISYLCLEL